mmetsp:Transcript_22006/g.48921  ORF Transcript_22006/g.48921 Transcript_22006/m.48921 type:complete len:530 (-) Transcript_22006:746-2335(-)
MILHLYIGDLSVEQLPSELKFLKVLISDGYRDNGIASDLFLSENIVRFNQTIHIPIDASDAGVNVLEITLISVRTDGEQIVVGHCSHTCTEGDHSITKNVTLCDTMGTLSGRLPITCFYYKTAISLGARAMFQSRNYEPSPKEYSFLLSRRFRRPSGGIVTFDDDVEHSLNNEARDYFSKEFELVSQSLSKKAAGEGRGKKRPKSAPSGRGSVVMSDAVRGKCTAVQLDKVPAKVRPTLMSVGFLTQWPERGAPAEAQKSDRLWRAVAVKKQTVQDVAAEARRRNESTARKQAAIRVEKIAVELRDSGLKEVLRQKEDQIDLLRKTLSHLRLSDVHSHRFDHSEQLLCRTVRARAKASVPTSASVPRYARALQSAHFPSSSTTVPSAGTTSSTKSLKLSVSFSADTVPGPLSRVTKRRPKGKGGEKGGRRRDSPTAPKVATPVLVPSVYSTSAKPFSPYRASSLNRSCDSAKSQEGSDVGHLSATFDNDFFSARAEYADKGDQRGGDWLAAARASVHELNISQPIHNLE